MDDLKQFIREVQNFPKEGILFYDITTMLKNAKALRMTVDRFVWIFSDQHGGQFRNHSVVLNEFSHLQGQLISDLLRDCFSV